MSAFHRFPTDRLLYRTGFGFILAAFLCGSALAATSVRLAWDESPESDVAGYRLRWGTAPGDHSLGARDVPGKTSTTATIQDLTAGVTYYFVVHAYDLSGNESGPSNEISVVPAVTVGPILTLSGGDSPDPVAAGSNLTYTLAYANTGDQDATGVVLTDAVPANTVYISATQGGTHAGGTVTWNLGTVARGASGSVTLTVRVASPLANGTILTNGTYSIDSIETAATGGPAVTTLVASSPTLNISAADAPDPVAAGSNLTYTLAYSNTGNMNATGVVIGDTLPSNTTFVSATGGGTQAAGAVTWSIGSLAAGASGSVQLVVAVATPLANGTLVSNSNYSIDSAETVSKAGAAVTTTVSSAPVFSISMTDSPDPVSAGSNITYTIAYSNTGNMNATGVMISDTLPANTAFVSATGGGVPAAGVVTWNIGPLAAGASGSVQLVGAVSSPLANGTLINHSTYSIDSNETAPKPGTAVTTTVSSAPVFSISMTDAPDPVAAGSNITYTIAYSNTGNMNATGVMISDTLPANTAFVSATGGGAPAAGVVTWNIGPLAAGASGSVQLVVAVTAPLANGTLINNSTYGIDSNETPPKSGTAVTTTVSSAPVFSIAMTDAPDPVEAGSNLTYTINYSNTGNMNATGVVVSDTLPANTTFVSATGGGSLAAGAVTWNIGMLAAGSSGSVQLIVAVAKPLTNATILTNAPYTIDSNETASKAGAPVTTTVSSSPALSISMTDAPDPVAAGSNITYTLNYANTGNMNATGVVIADTLPANATFVSATGGGTLAGGVVTWAIGSLAAGASGSVQLVLRVASPLANGTVITNGTYTIDSNETAPIAGAAATTTVTSGPILTISKTDSPDPATAGVDTIAYTIRYANTGNADATGVVVTDTIPPGTTFVSATGGGTAAGGVVTWTLGTLPPGASGSLQMSVSIDTPVANGAIISNAAYGIDSNETAPVSGAAVTTTVVSATRFVLTATDAPDPVAAGGTITYTLSYQNVGTNNATGLILTDAIPANTSFVSATGGGTLAAGVVTWTIGTLASGASGSVQLVVRVTSPLPNGTIVTNAWSVDSNETAPASGPDATTTVTSAPVLNLSKTDAPDPVAAGSNITYSIGYSNTGTMNATGVTISDSVPANTTFVSATGGGSLSAGIVTWTIGSLAAGASGSLQMVVAVTSPLANGTTITSGASQIRSNETAPRSGPTVTTTVSSAPALSITLTDAPDPVAAGGSLTYTISYTNAGTMNATGVTMSDAIPANTTFVSATGGGSLAGGVVTWSIGSLAAGASGSVQMVVAVTAPLAGGTLITNGSCSIDSNETSAKTAAPATTTVSSAPALSISMTDAPDPVAAGSNITYTIGYSNTGTMNATGVVISDPIPANTGFVSATGGGTPAAGVVTWNIGSLAAGASGSVQLVVAVTSPLPGGTLIANSGWVIDSAETSATTGPAVTTAVLTGAAPAIISAIEMTSVSIYIVQGETQTIRVAGSNFQPGATVGLGSGISAGTTALRGSTEITVPITIAGNAALGSRTLTVTNSDGQSGARVQALQVVRTPDMNGDCLVNSIDLNFLAIAYGSTSGSLRFSASADLDGDGDIDGVDLVILYRYMGHRLGICP